MSGSSQCIPKSVICGIIGLLGSSTWFALLIFLYLKSKNEFTRREKKTSVPKV